MSQHLTLASSRDADPIIIFGARVEAALSQQALERARKNARLDAFLGNSRIIDAKRDRRGVYLVR